MRITRAVTPGSGRPTHIPAPESLWAAVSATMSRPLIIVSGIASVAPKGVFTSASAANTSSSIVAISAGGTGAPAINTRLSEGSVMPRSMQ